VRDGTTTSATTPPTACGDRGARLSVVQPAVSTNHGLIRRVVAAACLAVVTVISTAAILSAAPIASAPSAPTSYPLLAEAFRQATPPAYSFGDGVRGCTPDNNRTRVEVRSLSAAGRTRFTTAMRALIDSDVYQLFVAEYIAHLQAALGGAQFLPWHRLFLVELEGALRTIDPTVALPWCTLGVG